MRIAINIASEVNESFYFSRDDSAGNVVIAAFDLAMLLDVDLDAAIKLFSFEGSLSIELENEDSSILQIACKLFRQLTGCSSDFEVQQFLANRLHVYAGGLLIKVYDEDATVASLTSHFPDIGDFMRLIVVINGNAGELFRNEASSYRDKGVRYFIHAREQGKHHEPHVHVKYENESSAVIGITSGQVLKAPKGKFPLRNLRAAQRRILDNKEMMLKYWNAATDGFEVNLNLQFGKASFVLPSEWTVDCGCHVVNMASIAYRA